MNFKDCITNVINIDAVDFKKEKRVTSERQCQTSDVINKEVSTQSYKNKSIGNQTSLFTAPHMSGDDGGKLSVFLKRIEDEMIFHLNNNEESKAFEGYNPLYMEDSKDVSKLASISCASERKDKLSVTCVCWNNTGTILVAGYGRTDHGDCCIHNSLLTFCHTDNFTEDNNINTGSVGASSSSSSNNRNGNINSRVMGNNEINKNNKAYNKQPNQNDVSNHDVIEMDSCVTCLQAHPHISYVMAVGTCNGGIKIVDISKTIKATINASGSQGNDDCVIAQTDSKDDHHLDLICSLNWVKSSSTLASNVKLISASLDGSMFEWSFEGQSLTPIQGFVILTESLSRPIRAKVGSRGVVSITCMTHSHHENDIFIAGSDVGAIFKFSLSDKETTFDLERKSQMMVTVPHVTSFSPHKGTIHSIHSSHTHPLLFITASADGVFSIYSLNNAFPLLQTHPGMDSLFSCVWSPWKATCVVVTGGKGDVAIYEIGDTTTCVKVAVYNVTSAVLCSAFNHQRPSLVCTGDAEGVLHLWKMGRALQNTTPSNLKLLKCLAGEE